MNQRKKSTEGALARGSPGDQTALFEDTEADAWFRRNRAALQHSGTCPEIDLIEDVLGAFRPEISSVLELGCSDGQKVERLAAFFEATGYGVDPSTEAVAAGKKRLEDTNNSVVTLSLGTADRLPFATGQFDLVHFGFSLYVVSRERVFQSLAEADRVLRAGGFLTILDFDPHAMHKRSYAHRRGLFSYKTRYDEWFVGTGHYHLVAKRSFSHASNEFSTDENERVAITVLYKEPLPYPLHD